MSRLHPAAACAFVLILVACPGRDTTPDPGAEQQPGAAADAPPATTPGDAALGSPPAGMSEQDVEAGRRVFHAQGLCYTCHGQDGAGTQLAPALDDQQWIHLREGTLDEIVQVVRTGVPRPTQYPAMMPPMGGAQLSEGELRAVAAYVYALSRRQGG